MTYALVDLEAPEPEAARRARMLMRLLSVGTAVLLVVGLFGLAVVDPEASTGGKAGTPLATVLAAAGKTADASSARFSATTRVEVPGDSSLPAFSMEGLLDFEHDRSDISTKVGDATSRAIKDGGTVYIQTPTEFRSSAVKTPWISIDQGGSEMGELLAGVQGGSFAGGGDPTATLDAMQADGVVKQASVTGTATVRGTRTTVYQVVLDGRLMTEKLFGEGSPLSLLKGSMAFDDAQLELSVDGQGLIRRMVMRMSASVDAEGTSGTFTSVSTGELYDFGVSVRPQIPPPDQVTKVGSFADLVGLLGGED